MATIALTTDAASGVVTWAGLAAGDDGQVLVVNNRSLVLSAVQAFGSFGGTVSLQVSLDGTNWATLRDTRGNLCDFAAATLVELSSAARFIRPVAGAGVAATTVRLALGGA